MTSPSDVERIRNREVSVGTRPEKGFVMLGAGRDASPREKAAVQDGTIPDGGAVPDGGVADASACSEARAAEDAALRREIPRRLDREETARDVEAAGSSRERSAVIERFERRAQEIARAAEVGVRAMMEDEAELLAAGAAAGLVENRLPEIGDERRFAGRDPRKQPGRQNADPGIEQRPWSVDPEGRDAIPFGLKRRVVLRVPIFGDEERRRAPRFPVAGDEAPVVGLEGGVRVDDEEVAGPEKPCRVPKSAGGSEELAFPEEGELRHLRCLVAQVALHLVAEVMQINRYFADAGIVKSPEVRDRDRNV